MEYDDLTTRLVLRRFYESPEFRMAWADRIQKHFFNGGALSSPVITARHDTMKAEMAPIIKAVNGGDFWDGWWTDWVVGGNRTTTFLNQCRTLGMWPETLAAAFSHASGTIASGQTIALSHPNGSSGFTLYYTVDGSDPRMIGGGIQGNVYAGPLTVTNPMQVKTRVRRNSDGQWSPLMEAAYAPAPPQVLFTEIHYNPPGSGDATEFIELTNVGGGVAALQGASFVDGVEFTFGNVTLAAGQSIVLVKDAAAFAAAYPNVTIGGVFIGALNNSGDTLTLADVTGTIITSVTYGDSNIAGWPDKPDGEGHTLVLRRPWTLPNLNDAAHWRRSSSTNGNPGARDSVPLLTTNPQEDLDNDGYASLVEYALGTSDADASSKPTLQVSPATNGIDWIVTAQHPLDSDDADVEAVHSPDLQAWQEATKLSTTPLGQGLQQSTWQCQPGTDSRCFIKLRVTLRP
jgi:hypothetical protein